MGYQTESLEVISRPGDNTGVGVRSARIDANGFNAYSPTKLKQDSNIVHDKAIITILVSPTGADTYVFSPVEGTWIVDSFTVMQVVASTSGTLDLKACAQGTLPASGTTQLTAPMDLAVVGNNALDVKATLIAAPTEIGPGMRLGFDYAGTMTSFVGHAVLTMKRIR